MGWNKRKKCLPSCNNCAPSIPLTKKEMDWLRHEFIVSANEAIDELNYQRYLKHYNVDETTDHHSYSILQASRYPKQGWHAVYYTFMRIYHRDWVFPEALVDYQKDPESTRLGSHRF